MIFLIRVSWALYSTLTTNLDTLKTNKLLTLHVQFSVTNDNHIYLHKSSGLMSCPYRARRTHTVYRVCAEVTDNGVR